MELEKYLVTGGCGFIGSSFIDKLILKDNVFIYNIDKLTYSATKYIPAVKNSKKYKFEKIDICNSKDIQKIINKFKPNYIVNLAAETHVDRSIDSPDDFIRSNIIGTYNLLNESYMYWVNQNDSIKKKFKFIQISTDEVYGSLDKDEETFTESSNYRPNSPYSASKASSDHLVRSWFKTYNFPTITTNTCNNYGPRQFPEKLIPLTINKCLKKEPIPIYGSGDQIRDWIRVEDHVEGLLKVINKGKVGHKYNIGSNCEIANIKVVKDICNILNDIIPVNDFSYQNLIKFVEDRPGHDLRYAINNKKILSLGWKPKFTWKEGLRDTVEWYLQNEEFLNEKSKTSYSGERLGKL